MVQLGYWWNGSWGAMSCKKVWLYQLADGRYEVTWRGGDWRASSGQFEFKRLGPPSFAGRDGRHVYTEPADAITALRALLGEDWSGWKQTVTLVPVRQMAHSFTAV